MNETIVCYLQSYSFNCMVCVLHSQLLLQRYEKNARTTAVTTVMEVLNKLLSVGITDLGLYFKARNSLMCLACKTSLFP